MAVFQGDAGANNLQGGAENDVLIGEGGNDTLNGGAGADTMLGGAGDDSYTVDNAGDVVTETLAGGADAGGVDLVQTSVNFTLGTFFENLTATGTGNLALTGNELANVINGNGGANVIYGGDDVGPAAADTLAGGEGDDTYTIREGADDVVIENADDDVAGTVGGNDTVLVVASAGRTFYGLSGGAADGSVENLIASDASSTLSLTLYGNAATQTIVGNAGDNSLYDGGAGADTMIGLGGDDFYLVSSTDAVVVEAANGGADSVVILGGAGSYTFGDNIEVVDVANAGAIDVTTGAGDQLITANNDANRLDGGAGDDTMNGFGGDDTYLVDSLGDEVADTAGVDRVIASSSYAVSADIEYLTAAGVTLSTRTGQGDGTFNLNSLATTATSNYFVGDVGTAERIFGDSGENILNGRTGDGVGGVADTLAGLGGSDIYRVYDQADVVVEDVSGGSFDFIYTSADYDLSVNDANAQAATFVDEDGVGRTGSEYIGATGVSQVEVLSTADQAETTAINLTGNAYGQIILGNFGDNVITDGGSLIGAVRYQDQLAGLDGDDTYNVTAQNTTVNEDVGNGRDVVNVDLDGGDQTFFGLIAAAEVEYLVATGANDVNLQGNGFAQVITGNAAANSIDGAGGADTLVGGAGDDSYLITAFNAATARIVETGGDIDRVVTSVSFDLAANNVAYEDAAGVSVGAGGVTEIEQIVAADGLGSDAINLTGNGAAQILVGNYGNNILDGDNDTRAGGVGTPLTGTAAGDTLTGLFGNDTYRVYSQADVVRENAGEGTDVVFTSASYQLRTGNSVETLSAANQQSTTGLTLTGNEQAQTIIGTNGSDTIWGGAGNDTLNGRGGSDTFGFNEVGAANADSLGDFSPGDFIGLGTGAFSALGATFDANEFVTGTTAVGTNAQVVYNQAAGELFYDSDGTGASAATLFATIAPGTALGFNDFNIQVAPPATIAAA